MIEYEKLDSCKKEIRSILLPNQKGCYLSNFQHDYRSLIGRRLPSAEFGFRTDIEFLYSMPDVVKITPYGRDYHLFAVADENTKHIQKMVARQKPAKLKGPPPLRFSRSFNLPPRFLETKSVLPPKTVSREPKLPPAKAPINNIELPPSKMPKSNVLLPTPKMKNSNTEFPPTKMQNSNTELPPTKMQNSNTELPSKLRPKEEVILLMQRHKNKLALDDFLVEYKRMYNKNLSLSSYGLSSIEEILDYIPELEIKRIRSVDFIVFCSEEKQTSNNEVQISYEVTTGLDKARIPTPEVPSTFNSNNCEKENYHEGDVPNSLRKKLQKVADRFPDGVPASEFPNYFEEATSESLDFNSLGYRCLADLIDEVPDIFIRKPVAGSRKDYIIYPAKSANIGSSFIEPIILNLRKILEGYPEGIQIKNILHVYSINFKDTLHIEDLGYDNIETFLSSIKHCVPLTFGSIDGEKSVHLKFISTNDHLLHRKQETYKNEPIPFDALIPEFAKFKPIILPADFDCENFIPIYVSAVAHPGCLFIQFHTGEDATHSFGKMSKELESFYNSSQSELYMLKTTHLKEGASCVAKWPSDNHWYRVKILSCPSMNTVKVLYVDYGTTDTIPTYHLRYVKTEFVDLPVQALQCRLSHLKPPKNEDKWYVHARNRILSLCKDIPLMAQFDIQHEGVYSIVLCDTNGKDDVYINDVLCNEGFAEYDLPAKPSPEPVRTEMTCHPMSTLDALQAQYFLKAFAAVAPSFAQNVHYLKLLEQINLYCQAPDLTTQNIGMPSKTPVGPPGFHSIPPNFKPYGHPNNVSNAYQIGTAKTNVNPTDNFLKPSTERDSYIFPKSTQNANLGGGENDDEIFDSDDDDDEKFQQFCQKISSSDVRYVKRVMLGDGYRIHIIVVESMPYASSGDVSQLIWNNKEADYLFRKLQLKEIDIPHISLSEDGNEELFYQLNRFNVKGVQNVSGFKSSILLFSLKNVIRILNTFGHPSITLRTRLKEEITTFNPNDPYWQHFYADAAELENEDNNVGATDDDKIKRLCLYDLYAMKESIVFKKKKILNTQGSTQSNEIHKLEQLQKRVLQRIQEIEVICEEFN